MTTAQILKRLESAKSEQELLALAAKLGVATSFLNIGSVVEAKPEKESPPSIAKKLPEGRKPFRVSLSKKKPVKKASERSVKA